MLNTFDSVDQLISEWNPLQPVNVEARKKLDKKFRLEFNYNSNHLEGNTLTYGETELLLLFDDTRGNHSMREYEEMKSHDAAWQMLEEWARDKGRPLTEQAIKNLNEVILVRPYWKEAITSDGKQTRREIKIGSYKQFPNSVRLANGELFEYASPVETPALMQELLEWYRSEEGTLHPVTLAAMLHYKFVRIHPFDDGNGRIARMLMNYVLLRNDLPPVIIKSEEKQSYFRVLHIADTGDYEAFIIYVAEQLIWSLQIAIKAAKGESIEEEKDVEKEIVLFKKSLSRKKESNKIKTHDAVKWILYHSATPLFIQLKETMIRFNDLFHETVIRFIFSDSDDITYNIKSRSGGYKLAIDNQFPDSFIEWLSKVEQKNIIRFGIEFSWDGYKLSTPAFSVGVYVLFTFDKFSYHLSRQTTFDEPNHYLEKNYEQQLSKEEIAFTVKQVANDIIEEIKKNHFDE